jgi:hypothetical protein
MATSSWRESVFLLRFVFASRDDALPVQWAAVRCDHGVLVLARAIVAVENDPITRCAGTMRARGIREQRRCLLTILAIHVQQFGDRRDGRRGREWRSHAAESMRKRVLYVGEPLLTEASDHGETPVMRRSLEILEAY